MNTFFARPLLAPADAGASSSTASSSTAAAGAAASASSSSGTAAGGAEAAAGAGAGATGAGGAGAAAAGATTPGTQTTAVSPAGEADDLGGVEPANQGIDAAAVEAQKKAADDKKAAEDKAKTDAVVTFKPPEGSPLKAEEVSAWGGLFKDSGLNSEQAQKLVDNYTKLLNSPEAKAAQQKAADDARKQKVDADLALSKALPKLGGDNFKATIASAKSVLAQYDGGVEVSKILKETGLSANPAFVRFLAAVHAGQQSDSTTTRINPAPPTVTNSKSELERWGKVGKPTK